MTTPSRFFFIALVVITAMPPLTVHLALPAFPAIQHDLHPSTAMLQLAISLAMFTMASATMAYGPLSDRYGRRPVLLVGLTLFAGGGAICYLASNIEMLIFGRFVQAAGAGCGTVIARAMTSDAYGRDRLAKMLGYVSAASVIAPTLAGPLGGFLIDQFDWRAGFAFATAGGAAIFLIALFGLPETNREPVIGRSAAHLVRGYVQVFQLPGFAPYALQIAFGSGAFFVFLTTAPYVAVNVIGLTATQYGLWFTSLPIAFAIGSLIPGRFCKGVPLDRIVFWGGLIIIVSVIGMVIWAGIDTHSPLALFLPMFTMSIGQGISVPAAQAGGIGLARNLAGTASGMFIFIQWTLAAICAQISGVIADGTVYPALALILLVAIGSFIASVVIAIQGARRRRARDAAPGG